MKAALVGFRVRPLAVFGGVMILFASGAQTIHAEQRRVDADALPDYPSVNPAQGDISDGLIDNLIDELGEPGVGHPGSVSRLLTGAWVDWHPGIRPQNGDTVRHGEHVYRALATFDTTQHESNTPPTHTADGVTRARIRNVVFRGVKSRARNGFMAA